MSGGLYDRALTVTDCQAACAQRYPDCVAINVNRLPSGLINCYLVPQIGQLTQTLNVDNYLAIISSDCEITRAYSVSRSCAKKYFSSFSSYY